MAGRLFALAIGILALESRLMAGSILGVWLSPPSGVSCNTALATGVGSETLTLGACSSGNGPVTFDGQSYGSVTATPLDVAVGGFAGNETGSFSNGITIGASAQYDGSLEAVGGSGSAFLEFEVLAVAADVFEDFAMASEGINFQVDFTQRDDFMVPVTFGEPVDYSLSVSHWFYSFDDPEPMIAEISIRDLEVVDANGVPIAGASIGAAETGTAEVPEPGSAALMGIGAALLIFGGCLKRWSRERQDVVALGA